MTNTELAHLINFWVTSTLAPLQIPADFTSYPSTSVWSCSPVGLRVLLWAQQNNTFVLVTFIQPTSFTRLKLFHIPWCSAVLTHNFAANAECFSSTSARGAFGRARVVGVIPKPALVTMKGPLPIHFPLQRLGAFNVVVFALDAQHNNFLLCNTLRSLQYPFLIILLYHNIFLCSMLMRVFTDFPPYPPRYISIPTLPPSYHPRLNPPIPHPHRESEKKKEGLMPLLDTLFKI